MAGFNDFVRSGSAAIKSTNPEDQGGMEAAFDAASKQMQIDKDIEDLKQKKLTSEKMEEGVITQKFNSFFKNVDRLVTSSNPAEAKVLKKRLQAQSARLKFNFDELGLAQMDSPEFIREMNTLRATLSNGSPKDRVRAYHGINQMGGYNTENLMEYNKQERERAEQQKEIEAKRLNLAATLDSQEARARLSRIQKEGQFQQTFSETQRKFGEGQIKGIRNDFQKDRIVISSEQAKNKALDLQGIIKDPKTRNTGLAQEAAKKLFNQLFEGESRVTDSEQQVLGVLNTMGPAEFGLDFVRWIQGKSKLSNKAAIQLNDFVNLSLNRADERIEDRKNFFRPQIKRLDPLNELPEKVFFGKQNPNQRLKPKIVPKKKAPSKPVALTVGKTKKMVHPDVKAMIDQSAKSPNSAWNSASDANKLKMLNSAIEIHKKRQKGKK